MHPLRKKRLMLVSAMVVGVSLAMGLILYALQDSVNYFFPPADIAAGKAPIDKRIRVGGMVLPGSIQRDDENLTVSFVLTDYQSELPVSYQGILPDLFAENEGAVAAGKLQSDGRFIADEVLAKHDETYMPPEVAESLKKSGMTNNTPVNASPKNKYDKYKNQGYKKNADDSAGVK